MTMIHKFLVTEYSFGKTVRTVKIDAKNGPDAICKALHIRNLPFGYIHEGNHMTCHAQFGSDGKTGTHARMI